MKRHIPLLLAAVMLGVSGCAQIAHHGDIEEPKTLILDGAPGALGIAFAPGSSRIPPAEVARLRRIAAAGGIAPSDRVTVALAGAPALAAARFDAVAASLLPYGIVASPAWLPSVPRDVALIRRERYLVTLPPCPDWSKPSAGAGDFTNTFASNFGCASAVNLGLIVASPADLAGGRQTAATAGQPAAAAVNRYLNDKVVLPAGAAVGPIAAAASAAPAGPAGTQP